MDGYSVSKEIRGVCSGECWRVENLGRGACRLPDLNCVCRHKHSPLLRAPLGPQHTLGKMVTGTHGQTKRLLRGTNYFLPIGYFVSENTKFCFNIYSNPESFRHLRWSLCRRANATLQAHQQISRRTIMFQNPLKVANSSVLAGKPVQSPVSSVKILSSYDVVS